jgi:O-antigen/teichoic acid export membrane protein
MFYGALATIVRVGANLLLLPLVLSRLSQAELALWWVFLALGAFANLGDFGFGQAISRVYAFLWAGADDFDSEGLRPPPPRETGPNLRMIGRLNATVIKFYFWLAVGVTLLLGVVGTFILIRPIRGVDQPLVAWYSWGAYLLVIAYTICTNHWTLACQGVNRVRELQVAQLWSGLAYVASAVALLQSGFGLLALVVAAAIRGVIARQLCRRAFCRAVSTLNIEKATADFGILARLWPNAWKFGILSLGSYIILNGSLLISSQILGDGITASFGLTAQVGTFLMSFSSLWLTVKWPEITVLRTQGQLEKMAILFARRLALVMVSFIVLSGGVMVAGNWLLSWKGTHTQLLSTPCLILYLVYLAQQLFYTHFGLLTFTENVVPFYVVSFFTALGLIGLSLWLTPLLGLWGLLIAPLLAEAICSTWYPVMRGFKGQPFSPRQFIRAAIYGRI